MGLRENTRANAKTDLPTVDLANAALENDMETPGLAGLKIIRTGGDPPAQAAAEAATETAAEVARAELADNAALAVETVAVKAEDAENVVLAPMRAKAMVMVWGLMGLALVAVIVYIRTEKVWLHRGAVAVAVMSLGGAWFVNAQRRRSPLREALAR